MIAANPQRQHRAQLASAIAAYHAATVSRVASYAHRALLKEVTLTPKPGLVDRRNSGAHDDMDLQTFVASARAIAPWWPQFIELGYSLVDVRAREFLPLVRPAGLLCERAMLEATGGVNTHKGAIFSLGLLCCAVGRVAASGIEVSRDAICSEVAMICVDLVEQELTNRSSATTAGERSFKSYQISGARGEAASGFALVRTVALPVYDSLMRKGISEELALLQVLLHLLAANNDTNLLSRGGLPGLSYVRARSRNLLREGGVLVANGAEKMQDFDDDLIARDLSPGGSADLLAVACFLTKFRPAETGKLLAPTYAFVVMDSHKNISLASDK